MTGFTLGTTDDAGENMPHCPELPIRVTSHKRSGTHLLMASIWKNFQLPDVSLYVELPKNKQFVLNGAVHTENVTIPWAGLWRSPHGPFRYSWKKPETLVHVIRNPLCVMLSLWRMEDPEGKEGWQSYFNKVMLGRWKNTVKSHMDAGIHIVRYEDLVEDFQKTMNTIQSKYGLVRKPRSLEKITDHIGWSSYPKSKTSKKPTKKMRLLMTEMFPKGVFGYGGW